MYGCEEDGWETEKKLLRSDLYRNCTISEMAKIHSPEKDGNDPVKYAKDILAESGVSPLLTFGKMDDATLETVMKAIKKEEGYYNLKETRVEKWVYTTNITVTDGVRPAVGFPLKVIAGTRKYDCKTDKYGRLAPIVHKTEGMNIEVKADNLEGEYETIYSAQAGNESKNIVLKRYLVQYKAHTLTHDPEPPHEKSQPEPIEYIVQSGDNLSKVAARYEASVSELVESNRIKDPNKIYPGQKIVIYGRKNQDNPDSEGQSPQDGNGESYPLPPYPADIGGTTSTGTGESYPLPPYPTNIDGTASTSSQVTVTSNQPISLTTVGSRNSSNPVAIIEHDQRNVPWMDIAIREAKRWHGMGEEDIETTEDISGDQNSRHNYHKLAGLGSSRMSRTSWCASFVSYCLKESNTSCSASQSSQFPLSDPFLKVIDKPVYGAIMVRKDYRVSNNRGVWQGHITFVYGKTQNGRIVGLGGNQGGNQFGGGTVKLSDYSLTEPSGVFYIDITTRQRVNGIMKNVTERNVPVYQKLYKFYFPVSVDINEVSDLPIVDVDSENYDRFGIGERSNREGGGV